RGEQAAKLLDDAVGGLLARGHAVAVEAAEGAVVLLAPPAAAAGLVGEVEPGMELAVRSPRPHLIVVVGVIRRRQRVEIATGLAADDAIGGRLAPLQTGEKIGEGALALAGEDKVDVLRERGDPGGHLALAVGAADDGERLGPAPLDRLD